jgi:hypothetical protein
MGQVDPFSRRPLAAGQPHEHVERASVNKHTPGPWRLNENNSWKTHPFSITVRKPGVNSTTIANIPTRVTLTPQEHQANARLISAAPDLLEALQTMPQGLLATDEDLMRWIETARGAIDKATGPTT